MRFPRRWLWLSVAPGCLGPTNLAAQVDPVPRELIQFGYNGALQGHQPFSGYAFFYWNKPQFTHTNLTLRVALAPTYIDSELGISRVLDPYTDLGVGAAGGGFADTYDEIRQGKFYPSESFIGHGGELSLSLYHCFNPDDTIPLNGMVRGIAHYSIYTRDEADPDFVLPEDHGTFSVRTGLRWGGREPTLYPSLAMELSVWYEGSCRTDAGGYGIMQPDGTFDRRFEDFSHLLWSEAMLAYTFKESERSFFVRLTAGTSLDADRFSAYRLGALLPLVSEFPLSLPGYYYQEITAEQFVLLNGVYIHPIDSRHRWNLMFNAGTAVVDYLPGLEQPGHSLSGVGGGIFYRASNLKFMLGYAYGIDAIRSDGRGAHSIGFLMQFDLKHARSTVMSPDETVRWRGWQRVLGVFTK